MPILTSDGKQVEKRFTADGENIRTVYNANGDIVFEEIDTAEGALPQSFKSRGKPLVNYRIYGNTVQDGTPTPENLVEVQGCGVETENGYKTDITSTNALENTSVTTPVYIGQSPLYKIGNYADYVDYKRGGVVRGIKEFVFTGNETPTITNSTTEEGTKVFAFRFDNIGMTDILNYDKTMLTIPYPIFYSSHFTQKTRTGAYYEIKNGEIGANSVGSPSDARNRYVIFGSIYATVAAFKNYLAAQYAAGTPVKIYYVLATPEFEPIADLPKIPTSAPQTVLDADMTIKPSKIWYKYKPQSYLEYFKSLRTGKVYQVKIPKFADNQTTVCVKTLDNEGLVAEPSTDTVEGRDDYLDIPCFQWWHCNYRRDAKGQAIITALEGDPDYSTTGTADVGSLIMSRYRKWEEFDEYSLLTISDSPHPELGLELMDVCKDKDGTDKGYGVFSAYHGLYSQPNIAPLLFVSHNTCLTQYQTKGVGYWGQTFEKLQFVYDNILLKYANKSSQNVFTGCSDYNYQYNAAYKDSEAHAYFPLTAAQAANIEIGSWCAVGYASLNASTGTLNRERGQATVRSKVESAKVLRKEPITLDGVDYVAVYLDIDESQAFNTIDVDVSTETYPETYSPIMISTMPWGSGSTDTVVGKHDGSLKSNTDSRQPFRIMGIECEIGAWEVITDTVMNVNADYSTDFYKAGIGVSRSSNATTIQNTYELVATMDAETSSSTSFWIGDVASPTGGIYYPSARGTGANVGCGDYCYRSSTGWREVLFCGSLAHGSIGGCCCLLCDSGLSTTTWTCTTAD